jgi:dihydrofolate reductase
MKTILVLVASLDGKITKWDQPVVTSWTSKEDQQYFGDIWGKSRLIVMGSGTYESNPPLPSAKHLIIVMTARPEAYRIHEVTGQLEFRNDTPAALVKDIESRGFDEMILLGGARLATSFFSEGFIDELWLTLEPRIFGSGQSLAAGEELNIAMNLISCQKVNEAGTLILKYSVLKH